MPSPISPHAGGRTKVGLRPSPETGGRIAAPRQADNLPAGDHLSNLHPVALGARDVLRLQRSVGNLAVGELLDEPASVRRIVLDDESVRDVPTDTGKAGDAYVEEVKRGAAKDTGDLLTQPFTWFGVYDTLKGAAAEEKFDSGLVDTMGKEARERFQGMSSGAAKETQKVGKILTGWKGGQGDAKDNKVLQQNAERAASMLEIPLAEKKEAEGKGE